MRVLLDECLPRPLVLELQPHEVRTVGEQGWTGKSNGELLALMSGAGFDVFVTIDQNLVYQQNLSDTTVAIVVLRAQGNMMRHVQPLMPRVRTALDDIKAGDVVRIAADA